MGGQVVQGLLVADVALVDGPVGIRQPCVDFRQCGTESGERAHHGFMGVGFEEFFRTEDGLATTGELGRAGVTVAMLRRWVSSGQVTAVSRGVYTPTEWRAFIVDDPIRMHGLAAGAVIRRNPGLIASHESAAYLHGIDLLLPPGQRIPPVTLTRNPRNPQGRKRSQSPRGVGGRVRVADLAESDITTLHGVRVTTAPRTVMDIARTTGFTEGVVATDHALRTRLVIRAECAMVLGQWKRWPGLGRARNVLWFADPRAESALESLARVRIAQYGRRYGLDKPALQVNIRGNGGFIGRVDFCWPEHRVIAEADGGGKYQNPEVAPAQNRRDERLHHAGWGTVHFDWAEICHKPDETLGRIWVACQRQRRLIPRSDRNPAR